MYWETVKIENSSRVSGVPTASVGFGRISLNASACELLDDQKQYTHVQLLKAKNAGRLCVGVKFLKEAEQNSVVIKRRKTKEGKVVGGIDITNKGAIEGLFGITGSANKVTRFEVKKYNENILEIVLN